MYVEIVLPLKVSLNISRTAPQYAEVPSYAEARQATSSSSNILSNQPNSTLLND